MEEKEGGEKVFEGEGEEMEVEEVERVEEERWRWKVRVVEGKGRGGVVSRVDVDVEVDVEVWYAGLKSKVSRMRVPQVVGVGMVFGWRFLVLGLVVGCWFWWGFWEEMRRL